MRGFVSRYFDNALAYDSPEAERLRDAARRNKMVVVMGLAERAGGSLYIAQWLIGATGETIAQRRKLKPTHAERTVFGEGDGSHLAVHDLDIGRLGALCCWEHLQPLSKYAMYAQNEQIHVAAWPSFSLYDPFAHALGAEVNNAASQIYAVEGSCFVVAPCAVVSQQMIDLMCDTPDKHQLIHVGGGFAVIYGPDGGRIGDKLAPDQEGIIYADIDLGMISVAKAAADPAGHYARPDVTRLLFNNRPANRVEHFALPLQQGSESVAGSDQPAPVKSSKDSAEPAVRPVAAE
jgi:aliphatic nitrilase